MGNLAHELYDFTPQCHHLRWLSDHLNGWQFGDQGLIEAIVNTLDLSGHFVEYGAGDGVSLPLTLQYRAECLPKKCFLIEIDDRRRESLRQQFPGAIVQKSFCWSQCSGKDIAVVVIDIDSHDSVVMREMLAAGVRPELLVVEHMDRYFPIGTSASRSIPEWMLGLKLASGHAIQDTAETLHAIATANGYERVGFNRCNSFFVRGDRFTNLFH
jgi:hypothetical protein